MSNFKQQMSFVGGEISPSLYAGVDLNRYRTSLKTLRNFYVSKSGGAINRPGTVFVRELRSSLGRLVPFIFNETQTYVLDFSYNAVATRQSFIKNGATVLEASQSITSITKANPGVITKVAHGYSTGEEIYITSTYTTGSTPTGMRQINDRFFIVQKINNDTFSLRDIESVVDLNTTSYGTFVSGTMARVYKITPPYVATGEFLAMQWVQQADVMTFTHPGYMVKELIRTSDTSWAWGSVSLDRLNESFFIGSLGVSQNTEWPTVMAATTPTAGIAPDDQDYRYTVTSVNPLTGSESCAGVVTSYQNITAASQANPCSITSNGHGLATGDEISIFVISGMTQLNYRRFTVTVTGVNAFTLNGVDSTGYTAYVSGGSFTVQYVKAYHQKLPTSTAPIVLTFHASASYANGAGLPIQYKIYRADAKVGTVPHPNVFGYVGTVFSSAPQANVTFNDIGYTPDITHQPPFDLYPFYKANGFAPYPPLTQTEFPAACGLFKGRLILGGSMNYPERIGCSKNGAPHVFTRETPIQDDSSFIFDLPQKEVSKIKHILDLGRLVICTSRGETQLKGDGNGNIKPSAINPELQSSHGSSDIPPLLVDGSALFVQANGSIIRDFDWKFELDGYRGNDVTIFASHLVEGHTIIDWAWQKTPNSIVWAVRDDGVLLSLTYIREQQILAWARHDIQGTVERVCCVPEGTEDALYLVVHRTAQVPGTTGTRNKVLLERMSTRLLDDITEANFTDSSVFYDGRNATAVTMTIASGPPWISGSTVSLTASSAIFSGTDVGRHIRVTGSDGTVINITITAVNGGLAIVNGTVDATVPLSMQSVATTNWAWLANSVYAWHLDALNVSVFADGYVISNPTITGVGYGPLDTHPVYMTVTAGLVTLNQYYAVIRVGLPYTCDIETLDIDTIQGETLMNKKVQASSVGIYFLDSREVYIGHQEPDDDHTTDGLVQLRRGKDEDLGDPPSLQSGAVIVPTRSQWIQGGHTFIRVIDPVPCAVLAISPSGLIWSK